MEIKFNFENQSFPIFISTPSLPLEHQHPNANLNTWIPIVCIQLTAIHMPTEWNLIIDVEQTERK